MVSAMTPLSSFIFTWIIDGIKQKLIRNLVNGKSWVKGFMKGISLDLFYLISILLCLSEFTNMCNFADDATYYAWDMDFNSLTKRLKHDSFLAIEWFENNNMELNQGKCHLLLSG